jgi:protein phosphatase
MLICPHCQFENPNDNKFCQKCGTSLSNKTCFECGADVPFHTRYCQECGTECGTIWLAIITEESPSTPTVEDEKLVAKTTVKQSLTETKIGSFLDRCKRYQLLEALPQPQIITANAQQITVRVLDCQPFHISPIETMLENHPQGLVVPSMSVIGGIPSLAQAYIALQAELQPTIPLIHDTWQQDNIQVVLIEDRSNWQLLLDGWQDPNTHPLQRLHWCYQMIQLWSVLEKVNCLSSLLDLSNLRLDDDQTLVLQRLYADTTTNNLATDPEKSNQNLNIKDLGRIWYSLCRESQRTELASVVEMLGDLEAGKISNLTELRSRLQEIATEIEPPATSAPITPQLEETSNTNAPTWLQTDQEDEWEDNNKNEDAPTFILPMQLRTLEGIGRTDVGRQRNHNEDYFGIESTQSKLELPRSRHLQAKGLYILCDGMGGHDGGEVASELAVNTLRQYFQEHWQYEELPTAETIKNAVLLANQSIYDLNQQGLRSGVGRMGTTLVMLLVQNTKLAVAHVGDSRLYRYTRKGGLEQMTIDHEVGQREIAKGIEPSIAYSRGDAYQLTQALGPRDVNFVHPDVDFFEIREDTLVLLASDGLTDNDLVENNCQTYLAPLLSSSTNLELGLSDLIDLANEQNGHDNITGILVRLKVSPNQQNWQ